MSKNRFYIPIIAKMTFEEYAISHFPETECSNFGYNHLMQQELNRWRKYDPEVYILKANKRYNYGLDFKVYLRYTTKDGLTHFNSISYGSHALTSNPFFTIHSIEFLDLPEQMLESIAEITPDMPRHTVLVDQETCYKRTDEARKYLANANFTVCTGIHFYEPNLKNDVYPTY